MRVECGSCKRVAESRFQVEAGAVTVTCTSCGASANAAIEPRRPQASTIVPIDKMCPKCGTKREPDAEACRSCGLRTARMQAYTDDRDAACPDDVRAAWGACVAAWNEPARHDALLVAVARQGAYAWAAGRYRDAVMSRPDDPIGPRQLDRLRKSGEAALFATASARPEKSRTPYIAVIGILGLLLVAIIGGVLYAAAKSNDPATSPPPHFEVR